MANDTNHIALTTILTTELDYNVLVPGGINISGVRLHILHVNQARLKGFTSRNNH